LLDTPKFTQIEEFGLKIYHLATLLPTKVKVCHRRAATLNGVPLLFRLSAQKQILELCLLKTRFLKSFVYFFTSAGPKQTEITNDKWGSFSHDPKSLFEI
jgi:hypothetical protein